MIIAALLVCISPIAIDGDTIKCAGGQRLRLSGIDAPEMGKCRRKTPCIAGDGPKSKRALQSVINGQKVTYYSLGTDLYGRTIAIVYAGDKNTSCYMIANGNAQYVAKWDKGKRVATGCKL